MVQPSIEEQNPKDTTMPMSPRTKDEVVSMMIQIETLQAQLTHAGRVHIQEHPDDDDMMFLLQTEYVNLLAVKQAIMWTVGWSDELLSKRAMALYERTAQE